MNPHLVNLGLKPVCVALGLLGAALAMCAQAGAVAEPQVRPGPGREVLMFDRFVASSSPVCLYQPAAECVDVAWVFADRNGDDGLSVEELQDVRDGLQEWTAWRKGDLNRTERSMIALGFLVVDSLGIERLHGLYDADGDGLVGRSELLADVRLDERPLGEILLDSEAVDRAAIAGRLGLPPALVDRLQP